MNSSLIVRNVLPLLFSLFLAGCGEKSVEYYAANPKEAVAKLTDCQTLSIPAQLKDVSCNNARQGYAIYFNNRSKAVGAAERTAIEKLRGGN